jgi:hypothetical protein
MMADSATMIGQERATALQVGFSVALIVALGIAIGTRGRKQARREGPTEAERHAALVDYLREHLSGADLAIHVVERLRRTQSTIDERQLFDRLYQELEADREVVRALLQTLGSSSRSPKRLFGQASGSVLKVVAGGSPGELSLFRTLEALAIAVQGKRCMWRALQSLHPSLPVPGGRSLSELESAAVRQWEAIDQRRRSLVPRTFATGSPLRED